MGKFSKKEKNEMSNQNSVKINEEITNKLNYSHPKKNYLENSQELNFIQKRNDINKFISKDINKKIDCSYLPNKKIRKNSKDSENLSTSNEENQPEGKPKKIQQNLKKLKIKI